MAIIELMPFESTGKFPSSLTKNIPRAFVQNHSAQMGCIDQLMGHLYLAKKKISCEKVKKSAWPSDIRFHGF
jgi:hypothetical protein